MQPLRVGDRGIIGVKPAVFDSDDPWPCARCGRDFPRSQTFTVEYRHEDGDPFGFMVCPPCADELQPVSVTIDLATLDRLPEEERLLELESLITLVEELRGARGQQQLALRWMDLDVLASARQMTVREFIDYLDERGLIIETNH